MHATTKDKKYFIKKNKPIHFINFITKNYTWPRKIKTFQWKINSFVILILPLPTYVFILFVTNNFMCNWHYLIQAKMTWSRFDNVRIQYHWCIPIHIMLSMAQTNETEFIIWVLFKKVYRLYAALGVYGNSPSHLCGSLTNNRLIVPLTLRASIWTLVGFFFFFF